MGHSYYIKAVRLPCTYWARARSISSGTMRGKEEFIYFPGENHWVLSLKTQIWQNFFKWLKETYKFKNGIKKPHFSEVFYVK
jgi:hypothetical protein